MYVLIEPIKRSFFEFGAVGGQSANPYITPICEFCPIGRAIVNDLKIAL